MGDQSLKMIAFVLLVITSNSYSNTVDTTNPDQIYSNTSLCQNNGFNVQTRSLGNVCFCHGTGFYGEYCEIACPEVIPVECILI